MAATEEQRCDVAIVGAGPAGAALALRLAGQGRRVALLERSRFDSPRVGETLSPPVQGELRTLGVWESCLALDPLPSWGTRSAWGADALQSQSHLLSPWGCGWHVDRAALDRRLAQAAAAAGANLAEGVAAREFRHDGRDWQLRAGPAALRARVLVDASGRSAHVARQLGASRLLLDPLVGIAATWADVEEAQQHHLLVEAVPEGWWYSAPLPQRGGVRSMVTMLMTDADDCARRQLQRAGPWQAALARAHATRRRLAGARAVAAPRVHVAQSQRLRRAAAAGSGPWLAVGDAALSVDPLSGSGVLRALRQAAQAAQAIAEILDRPRSAAEVTAAYESALDEECSRYLVERAQQYEMEGRFETPFWRRRRTTMSGLARPAGIEPAT